MPLTRYQIRNEYSLADPELYRAADKDDPEALLEGVAMAGLVGVLRQLGDLAEFAAEIFHDLHEQVMATAARGHGLMARVQQLEAEFPSIEKAFLSQTNHSSFYYNTGIDWHPSMRADQNLITQGDLPRFIMDSYEECRGPPQLFLLDKFDIAGAGACLKRYTDPSFFKAESMSSGTANAEVHRDKKSRKVKKKGSRWKNGETPDVLPTSRVKLHQLLLEERVESGSSDPARLVKLKKRQLNAPLDSQSGKSYMESFLRTLSPEHKEVHEISVSPPPLRLISNGNMESGLAVLDIQTVDTAESSYEAKRSKCSSPTQQETVLKPSVVELSEAVGGRIKGPGSYSEGETGEIFPNLHVEVPEKEPSIDGESRTESSLRGPPSDDSDYVASETDNYMDALATMESETETDSEHRARSNSHFFNIVQQGNDSVTNGEHQLSDSQSICNSSISEGGQSLCRKEASNYSDTQSHSADNAPSDFDGAAKIVPSIEACQSEMVSTMSGQRSIQEEVSKTKSAEQLVRDTMCVEVDNNPSLPYETRDVSCQSCLKDSTSTFLPLDPGSSERKALPASPQSDETLSDSVKVSMEVLDTKRNGIQTGTVIFPDPSHNGGISPLTVPAKSHPAVELDREEPNVLSDALLHPSSGLDLTCEQKSSNIMIHKGLQEEYTDDPSNENVIDGEIDSPNSVMSSAEEQLGLNLPELGILPESMACSSDTEEYDGIDTKDCDASLEFRINSEDISPLVDNPQTDGFSDQKHSEKTEDAPLQDFYSAAVDDLSPREKNDLVEASHQFEEIDEYACYEVETGDSDAASIQILTEYLNEDVYSDGIKAGSIQAEDVAALDVTVTSACTSDGKDAIRKSSDIILSPSRNPECTPKFLSTTKDAQNEVNYPAPGLRDSGVIPHNNDSNVSFNIKSSDHIPAPLLDKMKNSLPTDDGLSNSKSLKDDQDIDFTINVPGFLLDEPTRTFPKHDDQDIESANDVSRMLDKQNVCNVPIDDASPSAMSSKQDFVSLEEFPALGPSQVEQTQESLPLGDLSHSTSSKHTNLDVDSILQLQDQPSINSNDSDSSPNNYLPQLETLSKREFELQGNQRDAKDLCSQGEASPVSSDFQSEHTSTRYHIDQEHNFYATSDSHSEELLTQAYTSEFLLQRHSQKLETEDARNQAGAISTGYEVLPLTSQVNTEDTSSSPPLPPMQWRTGRFQQASLSSKREMMEHNQGLFSLEPPFTAGQKAQFGFPGLEDDVQQPQIPFLPLDDKSHHVSENSSTEGTTSANPSLPTLSEPRLQPRSFAFMGASVQTSSTPFSLVPKIEDIVVEDALIPLGENLLQLSNQSAPETCPDTTKAEPASKDLEGEKLNHSKVIDTSRTMTEELPQQGWQMSQGESASSLSLPIAGDEIPNGKAPNKLPRPRNPLIDAVVAHDKSKLRKVTERIRPHIRQNVDERGSLLEQIRTKSFNLKPAIVTRPSIPGPKTNLKIAAILEKANAIRQATVGSDEDDDEDSWSDS